MAEVSTRDQHDPLDPKIVLRQYLQTGRDVMLWKLEDLSEYDVRRPLTPTGTNLLGLVKHLATCEAGYFGDTFGRPFPDPLPWLENVWDTNADMWVTAEESRDDITRLYRRVWAHTDETIERTPLDGTGRVPHWPEERAAITLHKALTHMIAETHRHAGHADILREGLDRAAGLRQDVDNLCLPEGDDDGWRQYHDRIESEARKAAGR